MGCHGVRITTVRERVSCELMTLKWLAGMSSAICGAGRLSDFKNLFQTWWWIRPLIPCPACLTSLTRAERECFANGHCYMCNPENWYAARCYSSGRVRPSDSRGRRETPSLLAGGQSLALRKAHVCNAVAGRVAGCAPIPSVSLGRRKLVRRASLLSWIELNERAAANDRKIKR